MPCQYETPGESLANMQRDLDQRTAWLCWACETVDDCSAMPVKYPPDLEQWWHAHQEADRNRRTLEGIRAKAAERRKAVLAKLTDEEKDILGLED